MSDDISTRICLGTAQLGFDYGVANQEGRPDAARCDAILDCAIERGVLVWDTAFDYGDAEERIGKFLARHNRRDDVRIVSKLPSPPVEMQDGELLPWMTSQLQLSLRRLKTDQIYGYLVHDPAMPKRFGASLWDALQVQVDANLVRSVGASVYDVGELQNALVDVRCNIVQFPTNLFDRRLLRTGLVGDAKNRGCATFARSAFLQGALTISPGRLPARLKHLRGPLQKLEQVLKEAELTPLEAAMPFVLQHSEIDHLVIGVDNPRQLDDNLRLARRQLPASLFQQLSSQFCELSNEVVEPRRWKTD